MFLSVKWLHSFFVKRFCNLVDKISSAILFKKQKQKLVKRCGWLASVKKIILCFNNFLLSASDKICSLYKSYVEPLLKKTFERVRQLLFFLFGFLKKSFAIIKAFYKKDKKRAIVYFILLYVCYKCLLGFFGFVSSFFQHHKNDIVVAVREVKHENARKNVNCYGYLESDNNLNYISEVRGNVDKILVQEKQYVKEGQLIMVLDSKFTENAYISAKSVLESKKFQYEATKKLYEDGLESKGNLKAMEADLENAYSNFESAKKSYNGLTIVAPFNGYIDNINYKKGSQINPGNLLFTLERTDAMQVKCDVQNLATGEVHVGEEVRVFVGGINVGYGKISVIGDSVDVYTGSRTILVNNIDALEEFSEIVRPGMSVMLKIAAQSQKATVTISSEALETTETGAFMVKILNPENGEISSKEVRIYDEHDGMDSVFGLEDGDYVVERGHEFVEIGEKNINFIKIGGEDNSQDSKYKKFKRLIRKFGSDAKYYFEWSKKFFNFVCKELPKDYEKIKTTLSRFFEKF